MAISYRKNKKSGVTYVYDCTSVWVPELKQARNHRKYLGRLDENGNLIPSSGKRGRPPKNPVSPAPPVTINPDPDIPKEIRERDLEIARLKSENQKLRSIISRIASITEEADS